MYWGWKALVTCDKLPPGTETIVHVENQELPPNNLDVIQEMLKI